MKRIGGRSSVWITITRVGLPLAYMMGALAIVVPGIIDMVVFIKTYQNITRFGKYKPNYEIHFPYPLPNHDSVSFPPSSTL